LGFYYTRYAPHDYCVVYAHCPIVRDHETPADRTRVKKPSHRLLSTLQEFSIPLLLGVVVAVVWANTAPQSYEAFSHSGPVHLAINDIFMALFFGIAAGEIAEATLPGAALNPPSKALNPLFATIGGVVGPVGVFFAWVAVTGDSSIARGWGIPTATDIALAWLVARLVFGKDHPAVAFLLLLAIADDAIGLGIIAIFYPDPAHPVAPLYLLGVGIAVAASYGLRRAKVSNYWIYLIGPGVLSWWSLHSAHLHPALALVAVVPFMPGMGHDEGLFAENGRGDPPPRHQDTLNRFQYAFKLPVDLGLFAFALANAGVSFSSVGNATWAVLAALIVGKTLGVFLFSELAQVLGMKRPQGMSLYDSILVGCIAGIGLTVALFVAGVALTDPTTQGAAKMGALLSFVAAPLAWGLSRLKPRGPG